MASRTRQHCGLCSLLSGAYRSLGRVLSERIATESQPVASLLRRYLPKRAVNTSKIHLQALFFYDNVESHEMNLELLMD
jgi:hypothetical protein